MASPVVTTLSRGPRKVVLLMTWTSAGSDDQTGTVIYDSSVQAAAITNGSGVAIADPLTCTLNKVIYSNNSAAGVFRFDFYATTPVLACPIPKFRSDEIDASCHGGIKNYSGTGKNGDITFTSTGIASGESFMAILEVLLA